MRRFLSVLLASLALVPAALADRHGAGDGSLVVSDASARSILLKGNGLVFGHIHQGTLTVLNYDAADTSAPQISGATARIVGNTVVYAGTELRFLLPNGRYLLRIDGIGIDISAVGRGSIVATGLGTVDDGSLSVNSGKSQPITVLTTAASFTGVQGGGPAAAAQSKDTAGQTKDKGH